MEQQNIVRRLRSLPQEIQQPYDWAEFHRRTRVRAHADARRDGSVKKHVALAAALILVVVSLAVWVRVTQPAASALFESYVPAGNPPHDTEERTNEAVRWLASLPSEPTVMRVGTRAAVTGLEDRIAQLDDVLSAARVEGAQPASVAVLEQQRVRLVNSLVQVRYAETLVSASR